MRGNVQGAGPALAYVIGSAGKSLTEVAARVDMGKSTLSKATREGPRLSVHQARRVAEACGTNARDTVELLAHHVTSAPGLWKLDVTGLEWSEVCALVALVEGMRRRSGLLGACIDCDAGPGQVCACEGGEL